MTNILKKFFIVAIFSCLQITVNAGFLKNFKFTNPFKKEFTFQEVPNNSDDTGKRKFYNIVDSLSSRLKIKRPKIFIFNAKNHSYEYNAFAGYIDSHYKPMAAMGASLYQRWQEGWFTDQEIEAIFAHELCHIKFKHALKQAALNWIIDGPGFIKRIIVPTPSPRELIKNAYSRKLEKEADEHAIKVLADPLNLFSALIKLYCLNTEKWQTKEIFEIMYMSTEKKLVRENKSFIAPLIELLQTHPLTSKRMAQIKKYARKQN